MRLTRREVAALVAVLALFVAIVAAVVIFFRNDSGRDLRSTWPESAEFSTLGTGQERFSVHNTNLDYWMVLVDHETGNQYLYRYKYGLCPLLDVDGSPLRVLEASDDGE